MTNSADPHQLALPTDLIYTVCKGRGCLGSAVTKSGRNASHVAVGFREGTSVLHRAKQLVYRVPFWKGYL